MFTRALIGSQITIFDEKFLISSSQRELKVEETARDIPQSNYTYV